MYFRLYTIFDYVDSIILLKRNANFICDTCYLLLFVLLLGYKIGFVLHRQMFLNIF